LQRVGGVNAGARYRRACQRPASYCYFFFYFFLLSRFFLGAELIMGRKVRTLKRGPHRFLKPVGNPADPDGLFVYMLRYLEYRSIRGATEQSLFGTERYLRDFIAWCEVRSLERPHEITKAILESYQRHLFYYRKANGQPLSYVSQRGKLSPLKGWFKWLTRQNVLPSNPASELELPRMQRRVPRYVLTVDEVEAVMRQVDTGEPLGIRDRAVLETLYSTGMRRMEIVNLELTDIDRERGTVLIRVGKGRKDRLIPIGEKLVVGVDDQTLFLTRTGERFNLCWLSNTVARYIERANLGKRGACHLFRHTMATLMLENGCDIRFIQAMLGHAELSTTQIYTQVAIRVLKQMHAATHPGASNVRAASKKTSGESDTASADEPPDAVIDLLAALEREAEEERRDTSRH
jgi:integrase/recombinase XerD